MESVRQKRYCKDHRKCHKHQHYGCSRPSPSSDSSSSSSENSDLEELSNIDVFRSYAEKIEQNRDLLMVQFPKSAGFPNTNDMEWCSFCLGSEICYELYGDRTPGEQSVYYKRLPQRKYPRLSIILHLSQQKVKLVLRYLHQWFLIKGLKFNICMWMYALLACLDRSEIRDGCEQTLQNIYTDFERSLGSCEEWQKPRATMIMEILDEYFHINEVDDDSD